MESVEENCDPEGEGGESHVEKRAPWGPLTTPF